MRCGRDWSSDVCSSDLSIFSPFRPEIAEQIGAYLAHLDLLGALGNAIAAVVAVNMLERFVPRISHPAMQIGRASCRERVEISVGGVTWRRRWMSELLH